RLLPLDHREGNPASEFSSEFRPGSDRLGDIADPGLESPDVPVESQVDRASGAVAVLGHDELGIAGLVIGVVIVGPVEHEYDVGILLDRSRLAQIRQPGPAVLAFLAGPAELRQAEHGDADLAR